MSLLELVKACFNRDVDHTSDLAKRSDVRKTINVLIDGDVAQISYTAQQFTVLHIACKDGTYETVTTLLTCGARTDIQDSTGSFPIHQACESMIDTVDKVKALIDADVENLYRKDDSGDTPMDILTALGNTEAVDYLRGVTRALTHDLGGDLQNLAKTLTTDLSSDLTHAIGTIQDAIAAPLDTPTLSEIFREPDLAEATVRGLSLAHAPPHKFKPIMNSTFKNNNFFQISPRSSGFRTAARAARRLSNSPGRMAGKTSHASSSPPRPRAIYQSPSPARTPTGSLTSRLNALPVNTASYGRRRSSSPARLSTGTPTKTSNTTTSTRKSVFKSSQSPNASGTSTPTKTSKKSTALSRFAAGSTASPDSTLKRNSLAARADAARARAEVARARHLASIVGNFPETVQTNVLGGLGGAFTPHQKSTIHRTDTTTVSKNAFLSGVEVANVDRHFHVDKEERLGHRVKRKERYSQKTNETTTGSALTGSRRKTYQEENHMIDQFDDDLGLSETQNTVRTTSHTSSPGGHSTDTFRSTLYSSSKPDEPYHSSEEREHRSIRSYGTSPVENTRDEAYRSVLAEYRDTGVNALGGRGSYRTTREESSNQKTVNQLQGTVQTASNHTVHEDSFHSIPDTSYHTTREETTATRRKTGVNGTSNEGHQSTTIKDRTYRTEPGAGYSEVKQTSNTKVSFSNTSTNIGGLDMLPAAVTANLADGKTICNHVILLAVIKMLL